MKAKIFGAIACTILLDVSQAAATTYSVNDTVLGLTATGAITTGVSGLSDILSWSLTISDGGGGTATFNDTDGTLTVAGSDFYISGNSIYFNFGDNNPSTAGEVKFESVAGFPGTSYFQLTSEYVCGGSCDPGTGAETLDFMHSAGAGHFYSSPEVIAIAATPLPATLPLLASGLGALGLFGWRRKRKSAAVIQAA